MTLSSPHFGRNAIYALVNPREHVPRVPGEPGSATNVGFGSTNYRRRMTLRTTAILGIALLSVLPVAFLLRGRPDNTPASETPSRREAGTEPATQLPWGAGETTTPLNSSLRLRGARLILQITAEEVTNCTLAGFERRCRSLSMDTNRQTPAMKAAG